MVSETLRLDLPHILTKLPGPKAEAVPVDTDLSHAYEQNAAKIVQKQLMKAGVRLAAVLESALGEH